jgi:chromosome segregation ATPase
MGLFNKFKKENKKDEDTDVMDSEKIKNSGIEPTNDIQKEDVENELVNLQNLLKEKNERLDTIMEKIQLSKNEYGELVSKIIQSKKELRSNINSETNDGLRANDQDSYKISKQINDSKTELKKIQEDIIKNRETNEQIVQKIKKIDEELNQRRKELEVLKKRLGGMREGNAKNHDGEDSKSVVEAASQIVATTNKRLQNTMKELDVIRQLLDKERRAHDETKKRLQS